MVIFDFREEWTGIKHVAIATSKCVPYFLKGATSLPSFNSSASLLAEIFLILCHTAVPEQLMTSSVAIFA